MGFFGASKAVVSAMRGHTFGLDLSGVVNTSGIDEAITTVEPIATEYCTLHNKEFATVLASFVLSQQLNGRDVRLELSYFSDPDDGLTLTTILYLPITDKESKKFFKNYQKVHHLITLPFLPWCNNNECSVNADKFILTDIMTRIGLNPTAIWSRVKVEKTYISDTETE